MQQQEQSFAISMLRISLSLFLLILVSACASRPVNDRIEQVDPDSGYRPTLMMETRENNDPSTFFVLSFSGGGTRAPPCPTRFAGKDYLRNAMLIKNGHEF